MKICIKCNVGKSEDEYHTSKIQTINVCKECKNAQNRVYHKKHYITNIHRVKEEYLYRTYKITNDDYYDILVSQNFCCAGCGMHESETDRAFDVDHDHSCCEGNKSCGGCIRGLLCKKCNMTLGLVKDDPNILLKLVDYINSA